MEKKISFKSELLRFLITGVLCALLDFLVCKLFLKISQGLGEYPSIIISTAIGFLFGVALNYIMSTFWVFKNADKKEDKKTIKFIVLFVLFSFVGLLLSVAMMTLCQFAVKQIWNINISDSDISTIFTSNFLRSASFWAYFISFCLKTLVGLIWNYFTRKFILYKPKKEAINE